MGQARRLVAGIVRGVDRLQLKKITTDQEQLLQVLRRWEKEAETARRMLERIAVAYEAGRGITNRTKGLGSLRHLQPQADVA